jgi:hypothetical protein
MTNANNAKLVRITTRALGGSVSDEIPLTKGKGNQFSVVVEGSAGHVLGASGQPYGLRISALDLTTGINPDSAANNFSQQRMERFDAAHGWPDKVATFTVTLNDLLAVQGHLFRYYAILTSTNQIVSFVETPLFLLFMYTAELGVAEAPVGATISPASHLSSGGTHMNANDARISRLFTTTDGGNAQDDSPNEVGGAVQGAFDLILEAEAGNVIGDSGAQYTLRLNVFDVSAGVAVAAGLFPASPAFPSVEVFDNSTPADGKNNWQGPGGGADFVKDQRYKVTIGGGVTRGNIFQYTASLVSRNFEVVSIAQSNMFILV